MSFSKMTHRYLLSFFISIGILFQTQAQTLLQADGPGDTYELITSVLAPGYNPIEAPDCNHNAFGRHIEEIWDNELQAYVFLFHIHLSPDNDRCINFDRQRNEIKTYDKSPDSLLATLGEKVIYKWKFKLDSNFQPSSNFTHIHQLKAYGGSQASKPIITLTPRAGTPEKLQIMYSDSIVQSEIAFEELSLFKGIWINAEEIVTYAENGTYEIRLRKESDNSVLFSYTNSDIRMWRTNATAVRPKWGIYRSLNNSQQLRDESVRFADFFIEEICVENEWIGPTNSHWHENPAFWSLGVIPTDCHEVIIDGANNISVQNGAAAIAKSLFIGLGSEFTVDLNSTLEIK